MEIEAILRAWNAQYQEDLPVTSALLEATFFSHSSEKRFVFQSTETCAFFKRDENAIRLHLAVLPNDSEKRNKACREIIKCLDEKKKEWGLSRVTFGGGDSHLFPGVPLSVDHRHWFEFFSPSGEMVMDFTGDLDHLIALSEKSKNKSQGELRNPEGAKEKSELIEFVKQEFNGRWYREINEDATKGFFEHYFGFYVNQKISGYVRLYGWNSQYWAPGIYFTQPAKGWGGLGPVGVSSVNRGKGYGTEILDLSWKILKARGCKTVRVDWTTEKNFYEKAGLAIIQKYQPAVRD